MSRARKLLDHILANPKAPLSFRDFEYLLRAFGFEHVRTNGSHRLYAHPRAPRPLPVQSSGNRAKPYQVRQLLDMIETYELSIDE